MALVVTAAGPAVAADSTTGPASSSSILQPGERLTAHSRHDTLTSAHALFALRVYPNYLELDQAPFNTVWFATDDSGRRLSHTFRTTLTMQRNGNLVMRTASGVMLWQAGTRGRGNRAVVKDNGNLLIRSATGATLWATHTGARYLLNGDTLASGARMNQRWGQGPSRINSSLIMRRSGNLVFRCEGTIRWSTGTHVAGSSLALLHNGNLVVRTRRGRIVWRSHTPTAGPRTILDAWSVSLDNARLRPIWSAHLSSSCN